MYPLQVPTIDPADGALTGPAQDTAAAGVAITVVLVIVDAWAPHAAPASASAVAPTATANFRIKTSFGPNQY
jgi:hypothetical protein